jgi:hypothetical protein
LQQYLPVADIMSDADYDTLSLDSGTPHGGHQKPSSPETIGTKKNAASPRSMPMTTLAVRPAILVSSQFATFKNNECAQSAMKDLEPAPQI